MKSMWVARGLIEVLERATPPRLQRRSVRLTRRSRCCPLRTLSLGLKMRPLRGRCVTDGDSAGHARARCTRPRATHGYCIDRSAVAESTVPRTRNRPCRGRGIDRAADAESTVPRSQNRPCRGRRIDRSAVAESAAPRSRNRPLRDCGIDRSAVAESTAPGSRNRMLRDRGIECFGIAESAAPGSRNPQHPIGKFHARSAWLA